MTTQNPSPSTVAPPLNQQQQQPQSHLPPLESSTGAASSSSQAPNAGVSLPPLRTGGGGTSATPATSGTPTPTHKRSYQACIPCRRRKVRCDLGSVEAPHDPPCVRCRRESKQCFFSATRRRGAGELTPGSGAEEGSESGGDGSGRRKRQRTEARNEYPSILPTTLPTKPPTAAAGAGTGAGVGAENPLAMANQPQYSARPQHPSMQPKSADRTGKRPEPIKTEGEPEPPPAPVDPVQQATDATSTLLHTEIYNTPSALALLFEAVGRQSQMSPTVGSASHLRPGSSAQNSTTTAGTHRRSVGRKNSVSSANESSPQAATSPGTRAGSNSMHPPARSTTSSQSGSTSHRRRSSDPRSPGSPPVNRSHINNLSIHSAKNRRLSGRELSPSRRRVVMSDEHLRPKSILEDGPRGDDEDEDGAEERPPALEITEANDPNNDRAASPTPFDQDSSSMNNVPIDPLSGYAPEAVASAIKAWSRYRFVVAGWFTPREALLYIHYFYTRMSPLSPILRTYYRDPATHEELVSTEPVLSTTLLTLASRYCLLPGPGGLSRSYAIHEKLWSSLQGMFQRLMWGSEKRMRTVGTVVALVALTEWHCRGLHFPGEGDGETIGAVVPSITSGGMGEFGQSSMTEDESGNDNKAVVEGLGDSIGNLLEPAYRSDRMSWMLLGNALALAYELGVFDESEDPTTGGGAPISPALQDVVNPLSAGVGGQTAFPDDAFPTPARKPGIERVQKILVVSVMHLASRLGWTSMIPRHISHTVLFRGQKHSPKYHDHLTPNGQRTDPSVAVGNGAVADSSLDDNVAYDLVLQSWVELTSLMKSASELLFPSRSVTRAALRNGRYIGLLEHFQPLLRSWKREFDGLTVAEPMRSIMTVEYEYLRLYVNSLALQAIVDRCTSTNWNPSSQGSLHPSSANTKNNVGTASTGAGNNAKQFPMNNLNANPTITSSTFSAPPPIMANPTFAALMQIYSGDVEYIKEVVDASRCLLVTVVRKLLPGGWLKHAPVRTYLRIASAAMYLLKTFALGAKEDDIRVSLTLMDQTVYALRAASCDDVHLALRFADLLETLTMRIRTRFVRMSRSGRDSPERTTDPAEEEVAIADDAAKNDGIKEAEAGDGPANWQEANGMGPRLPDLANGSSSTNVAQEVEQSRLDFNALQQQQQQQQQQIQQMTYPTSFHSIDNFGSSLGNLYGDDNGGGLFGAGSGNTPLAGSAGNGEDWLALPIDPLFASFGAGVTQTPMGPDVGGMDLLELLLTEVDGPSGTS